MSEDSKTIDAIVDDILSGIPDVVLPTYKKIYIEYQYVAGPPEAYSYPPSYIKIGEQRIYTSDVSGYKHTTNWGKEDATTWTTKILSATFEKPAEYSETSPYGRPSWWSGEVPSGFVIPEELHYDPADRDGEEECHQGASTAFLNQTIEVANKSVSASLAAEIDLKNIQQEILNLRASMEKTSAAIDDTEVSFVVSAGLASAGIVATAYLGAKTGAALAIGQFSAAVAIVGGTAWTTKTLGEAVMELSSSAKETAKNANDAFGQAADLVSSIDDGAAELGKTFAKLAAYAKAAQLGSLVVDSATHIQLVAEFEVALEQMDALLAKWSELRKHSESFAQNAQQLRTEINGKTECDEPLSSEPITPVNAQGHARLQDGIAALVTSVRNGTVVASQSTELKVGEADLILAGVGNIDGTGNDGANTMRGNEGSNRLYAKGGNDRVFGMGSGDKLVNGSGAGDDFYDGGEGIDVITHRSTTDGVFVDLAAGVARGSEIGVDELQAIEGVVGGSGNDHIIGDAGRNMLSGEDGADTLSGGAGSDELYGGAGNDHLNGEIGADEMRGGADDDALIGLDGFDMLYGGGGADTLSGNAGNDTLHGGAGKDKLNGGIGFDEMLGGAGDDALKGLDGFDTLFGDDGSDWLGGNAGNDKLYGGNGADRVEGGIGADVLEGGEGNDGLEAGNGFDTLFGDDGDDVLHGNAGNDRLDGGSGNDLLEGGIGADTFVFARGSGEDKIADLRLADSLLLDASLLDGDAPSAADLSKYSELVGGNLVLNFGDGDVLTLQGMDNLNFLIGQTDFL